MKSLTRCVPLLALAVATLLAPSAGAAVGGHDHGAKALDKIRHFVVIYQENHSFDNLFGGWERVDGVADADPARTRQVNQAGEPYRCLLQNDVNLASPPLPGTCTNTNPPFASHFANAPFLIDDYIAPENTTCPEPGTSPSNGVRNGSGLPGGCTRNLVHRFYQGQYQLHGGRQDRYVTGSDAAGLTMGRYATRRLPLYRYLHRRGHPAYVISDRFFQAAFGGSFLNHQWLIAAATPVFYNARSDGSSEDLHSQVDANGMPTSYALYTATRPVNDAELTVPCASPHPARLACGDYAVNTIQPRYQPYEPGTAAAHRLPPQKGATIGGRLSKKGVGWAWYAGGWSNANGDVGGPGWTNGRRRGTCADPDTATGAVWPNCPSKLFQYHHQPFNFFKAYAPGTRARRRHLRDEDEFRALAAASRRRCRLKRVSFIKPIGGEDEHPGYASEHIGSRHVVGLLRAVRRSHCAKHTMIVVTYDEFGGQWDHVPPPGQGATTRGPHDKMGPGERVPTLTVAPGLRRPFRVDHASHDTTAILATLERRFRLRPLTARDSRVRDLSTVFARP